MAEHDWSTIREQVLSAFNPALLPRTELPALPYVVAQFMELSNAPETSVKELARLIEVDSGLTVELLRYANSAHFGLRYRVKSVSQALTAMGIRRCKMFMIATGTRAVVQAKHSKLINQTRFWNTSLQKALFSREVAVLLGADSDLAFCGALLQDFLLPVLTNELLSDYLPFVAHRGEYPVNIVDFEQKAFGWDHAVAGARLAHHWQLPDDLICCIALHHRGPALLADRQLGRTAAAAVALSSLLPDQIHQWRFGWDQLRTLEEKWPQFRLETLAHTVDQHQADLNIGVRNDFPLSRLCQSPPRKAI